VRDLVRVAFRAAGEKKAQDVKAIDIRGLSSVTDYMIIATGTSDTNVRAIAEGVRERLLEKGERPFSLEGLREGSWVLLDYVDFVVHVFHYEKRLYFGLEELWADAKPLRIAAAPARTTAARAGGKAAARPVVRTATREPLPPVQRTALKPAGHKGAVPKKAPAGNAAVPNKAAAAKKTAAPKMTTALKPKKAAVPKRTTKD